MKAPAKANLKKFGIVALVVAVAGAIIYFLMKGPKKTYTFDWAGGNRVAALNDGKYYAGLHITSPGGNTTLKVGDSVTVASTEAPGLAGKHKVIQLGSDDGTYDGKGMVVIDVVKNMPGIDTIGGGTIEG